MVRSYFIASLFVLPTLFAAPKGFDVKAGQATLSQNSHELTIKSGKDSIIHWDSFSIDTHEIVQFIQKNPQGKILNRVIGNEGSKIFGALKSNGKIFLINQNGILLGPSGRIETSGFTGSTLDISDADFLKGQDILFHNPGIGTLINLGTIECASGDITLIARAIKNEGTLRAKNGQISLAAGVEVLLKPNDDERISILSSYLLPNDDDEIAIENLGDIEALNIEMKTCKNPYEKAIHCAGNINALSPKEEGGRILLVSKDGANSVIGTLTASSGSVHVLGEEVSLQETAFIDVSGKHKGGEVLIGGDYQGNNPSVLNSKKVSIKSGAIINADSTEVGNGGRVITWGDEANHFYGTIYARGGKDGGDGGFVEVSSKTCDWLYKGDVTTSAPKGKSGILFLDPTDINITAAASNPGFPTATGGGIDTYNPTTLTPANLDVADIITALDTNNNNVVISTSSGLAGNGTVNFQTALTWNSDHSLTVISDRGILVSSPISSTFAGAPTNNPLIHFQANLVGPLGGSFTGILVPSSVSTVDGAIFMNGVGGNQDQNDGIYVRPTGSIGSSGNGAVTLIGNAQSVGPGNNKEGVRVDGLVEVTNGLLTIDANGGNGAFSQGLEVNFGGIIQSTGTGNMQISGVGGASTSTRSTGVVLATTATIQALGTGSIDIVGIGEGTSSLGIGVELIPNAGGTVSITTTSGNITIVAQGSVTGTTDGHGVFLDGSNAPGSLIESDSGTINITATGNGAGVNHGVLLDGASAIIRTTSGPLTINASTTSNPAGSKGVNLINGGNITTLSGPIYVNGTGGPTTGDSFGVAIINPTSRILSDSGEITVIGQDSGGTQEGILLRDFGRITSTTGSILAQTFSDVVMEDSFIESAGIVRVDSSRDVAMTATIGDTYIRSTGATTTVIADRNIYMNSNLPFISDISSVGDVAVVVDDAFPVSPLIGPGFIFKDADSTISSVSGRARVFTARQPLNTIIGNINGAPFVPGIQYVDTLQERWGIYYFNAFNGNPFTVFYKDQIEDIIITLVNRLTVANATLSVDELPLFPRYPTPFDFRYVGELCNFWSKKLQCRPHFSPYGSFIFTDDIYWIGERWDTPYEEKLHEYLEQNIQ